MRKEFTAKAGYDYRFGTVGFQVDIKGEREPINFYFSLRELLERMRIDPNDLAALMMDEYKWTEPGCQDINPARIRLLEETDWKGKTVLDAAGYDGFAAEIAHKGGAARAICLDNLQYEGYGWQEKRKPGVEYITGDIYEWTEPVDKTILYNVLYHVKDPWGLLAKVREFTREEMFLCTLFRYHKGPWVYLYNEKECNPTDVSVIWGPSLEALERMLRFTGWEAERYALSHDRVLYRCKPTLEPQDRNSRY